jgi:anhydro-N-acetylmuramic acid kinase
MSEIFIGLMSGTSADAIDAAAVDFSAANGLALAATHSHPLSEELRARISDVSSGASDRLDDVMTLSVTLSKAYANCANTLITKLGGVTPRAIGSHGQTVRHRPQAGFTVQLGSGAIIATMTGIPTVADFRSTDIALGGQGAPLVPAFHQAVFNIPGKNRAIVNIGGIANITLLKSDHDTIGFDTGPGNTLLDHWYRIYQDGPWDEKGTWSTHGTVIESLLARMLDDPYFSQAAPKSTGLEYFNLEWLERHLSGDENPVDIQATLRALTAHSIAQAINQTCADIDGVFICGGGARNPALMQEIQAAMPVVDISTTGVLNMDPQWVEASAFAWLARQRIAQQPGNLPNATGASRLAILGSLYLP